MKDFCDYAIEVVSEQCEGPFVEVCCGNGWLVSKLKGDRVGVDPHAPKTKLFRRMYFADFLRTEPHVWEQAKTIIMCYPPGPSPYYTVGEHVISMLLKHHTLVIIGPKPYEEMTVIGTSEMWRKIFKDTVLAKEILQVGPTNMAYFLKPGDGVAEGTEKKIMNGNGLWQLRGICYDEFGDPIGKNRR